MQHADVVCTATIAVDTTPHRQQVQMSLPSVSAVYAHAVN